MSWTTIPICFLLGAVALGCSSGKGNTDAPPTEPSPIATRPPKEVVVEPSTPPPPATPEETPAKDERTLVGTWTGDDGQTYTFSSDYTFTIVESAPAGSMTIAGDYKLDGNRINLDFTLITAKATDPRNQKEADQAVVALKTAMKPERDPIEWVADNEVVITQGTGPTHKATLKRKT